MKRTLLYILLTTLIITPLLFGVSVSNVHAQQAAPPVRGQAQAVGSFNNNPAPTALTCGFDNIGMCLASVGLVLRTGIGWVTTLVGITLNYVVQELVFRMGAMTGVLAAVTIAWSVMRDIANVLLVFLLIFVGIAIIIRATSYNSKQLVWRIVLAALLVNFSLYFAKVVIDVTNIFAGQTYIMILKAGHVPDAENCATSQITAATYDSPCFNIGLSGAFMNVLRVDSAFNNATAQNAAQSKDIGWNLFYIELMGAGLLLVLLFVFLAALVLFVTRFVTLIYLMIVSPIAFVGLLTGTFKFGRDWWNSLLNNAIFAPVFFLLMWVSMTVIDRMADLYWPTSGGYADIAMNNGGALAATSGYTILIMFFVAAALLIGTIIAAKRLSISGVGAATKFAGGAMFGTTAWMYRNTGGRYGNRWANDEGLRNRAAGYKTNADGSVMRDAAGNTIKETSIYRNFAARQQLKTAQRMGSASGDVRNSEPLGALTGGVLGKNAFNVGKGGGKGGYMGMRKKYVEENVKFGEGLGIDRKRLAELEETKSGSTKIVTDPITGQQTVVRTKGLDQLTSEKKTEAQGAQKKYQEDVRELQKARKDFRAGRGSQAEVDRLETRVARRETVARGRSQQLNAMENEGVILQDEMLKTNRAYTYADTIERNAGQFGYMAPGGIIIGTKGEATEAANAIRTKFKNQQKYRGMTEIFKEMEASGVIAPGTTPPGGAAPGGGYTPPAGGGGAGPSAGGGTAGGGSRGAGGAGPTGSAPYRRQGPPQPRPSPSTNIGGVAPQQPANIFTTSLPNERRGRDGAQGAIPVGGGGMFTPTPGEQRGNERRTQGPLVRPAISQPQTPPPVQNMTPAPTGIPIAEQPIAPPSYPVEVLQRARLDENNPGLADALAKATNNEEFANAIENYTGGKNPGFIVANGGAVPAKFVADQYRQGGGQGVVLGGQGFTSGALAIDEIYKAAPEAVKRPGFWSNRT